MQLTVKFPWAKDPRNAQGFIEDVEQRFVSRYEWMHFNRKESMSYTRTICLHVCFNFFFVIFGLRFYDGDN